MSNHTATHRGTADQGTANRGTTNRSLIAQVPGRSRSSPTKGEPAPASPTGKRPLTRSEEAFVAAAEARRVEALRKAIPILLDFTKRITIGDLSVWGKDPGGKDLSQQDKKTMRALRWSVDLYPTSFDYLNEPSAKTLLDALNVMNKLFIKNLEMNDRAKVFDPVMPGTGDVATFGPPMRLFPLFFGPWQEALAPTLVLLHEYFHRMTLPGWFVPGAPQIFHGLKGIAYSNVQSSLADATSLARAVLHLAFDVKVFGK